ncbi:AbrB/MazE/SpoVT family DNA-binding domain-containing protein [Microbacterium sp. MYb64]|uniref:AbrB/MazE/SpoVT family DNA-binding domain-containing protein n=1 Tax=Microbacterium sp. MYb64 TaxID=1848691 RepID=UPI000CFAE67C|nr:AbrB/MazE/SpoVT family DNA-binding domain-containing protein [Microbacterium sp. MYb64]PRB04344.1 AbrB family transcriptional regulator [Microbacterium sp. MYb64]
MPIATMTSKGQITLPKEMRDELKLVAGSKVMFVRLPTGQYSVVPKTGSISAIFGMLHREGAPVLTIEQMDDAVAEAVAEDDARTRSI